MDAGENRYRNSGNLDETIADSYYAGLSATSDLEKTTDLYAKTPYYARPTSSSDAKTTNVAKDKLGRSKQKAPVPFKDIENTQPFQPQQDLKFDDSNIRYARQTPTDRNLKTATHSPSARPPSSTSPQALTKNALGVITGISVATDLSFIEESLRSPLIRAINKLKNEIFEASELLPASPPQQQKTLIRQSAKEWISETEHMQKWIARRLKEPLPYKTKFDLTDLHGNLETFKTNNLQAFSRV